VNNNEELAQWLQDNRLKVAGMYGVPLIPKGITAEETWEWISNHMEHSNGS
jgi:hypothetical protein